MLFKSGANIRQHIQQDPTRQQDFIAFKLPDVYSVHDLRGLI